MNVPLNVLLIDDEDDIRLMVTKSLEGIATVITASTAAEGLALAIGVRPDLILLDMVLPDAEGSAVLIELRKRQETAGIPVAFCSGITIASEIESLKAIGAAEIIRKPLWPASLRATIQRLLGITSDSSTFELITPEMRERFLRGAPDRLRRLELELEILAGNAAAAEALDRLMRLFHGLTGLGTTFGFPQATELARVGEQRCLALMEEGLPAEKADLVRWHWLVEELRLVFGRAPEPSESRRRGIDLDRDIDVLFVDDDPTLVEIFKSALESEGITVRAVGTFAHAIAELDRQLPDILIVDVLLPDGSGFELIEDVRSRPEGEEIGAIVVSVLSEFKDKVEAVRCGADSYFEKPVEIGAVVRKVMWMIADREQTPAKVLSVDDDPEQAEIIQTVLESAGYDVMACRDPIDFPAMLSSFKPDLVLMDVLLPGVSGQELVRYLRIQDAHMSLPVVFLTTEGQVRRRIEAIRAGGNEYLVKPVSPGLLLASVTSQIERARLTRSQLERDGLTGLLTHTAFMERVNVATSRIGRDWPDRPLLVFLDLDHFKSVNDTWGHAMGDRVLVGLSALLRRRIRQSDAVGRLGGEEFAILLTGLDEEQGAQLVQRLLHEFSQIDHVTKEGKKFRVTFSAGVATPESPVEKATEWTARADAALYAAKRSGRNHVVIAAKTAGGDKDESEERIDSVALEALRDLGGDEFVAEMVETFLADAPKRVASIRTAVDQDDLQAARRVAHSLKSSSGQLGAARMETICIGIEQVNGLEQARTLLASLESALSHTVVLLNGEIH